MPVQYTAMKYNSLGLIGLMVLLAACGGSPIGSYHKALLPALPADWQEILGEPHWRLEWIGEEGSWYSLDLAPGMETPGLSLPPEWTTPVLAWPFWPSWDLHPGMMRPAGALFPWDSGGNGLYLSWKRGVDAVFWKELAAAERESEAAEKRLPWFFDWPRFRELFESGDLSDLVQQDPWLVDWRELSLSTVKSGFDRRRIKAMKFTEMEIPGFEGRWAASSPFVPSLDIPPGASLCVGVTYYVSVWVSETGILKCSSRGFVFVPR